ncbi:hypothetical protein NDU88_003846 [Pleurodeles waltl]|uniref:Uncharacterized protein n=1 Tax=Pleurodeles waltl TaxID=8319 RepID=A0AAV7W3A7_PLEWA|nr:hypothetical protein NDU88_003846 [Pleurodeles waltl]
MAFVSMAHGSAQSSRRVAGKRDERHCPPTPLAISPFSRILVERGWNPVDEEEEARRKKLGLQLYTALRASAITLGDEV